MQNVSFENQILTSVNFKDLDLSMTGTYWHTDSGVEKSIMLQEWAENSQW